MSIPIVKAYDNLVLQRPKSVLLILLLILAVFGYYTKDFKLDASADSLLLEDDVDLKLFRKIHRCFGKFGDFPDMFSKTYNFFEK